MTQNPGRHSQQQLVFGQTYGRIIKRRYEAIGRKNSEELLDGSPGRLEDDGGSANSSAQFFDSAIRRPKSGPKSDANDWRKNDASPNSSYP